MPTNNPFDKASRYLHKYGWQQNGFGHDGGPACLVGAVNIANGHYAGEMHYNRKERGYLYRAITALTLSRPSSVVKWNDREKTTKEDALAVLQYAAKEWDRDHS